jgi:hypothetical protein
VALWKCSVAVAGTRECVGLCAWCGTDAGTVRLASFTVLLFCYSFQQVNVSVCLIILLVFVEVHDQWRYVSLDRFLCNINEWWQGDYIDDADLGHITGRYHYCLV